MDHIDMEQYRRQIEAVKLSVIGLPEVTGFTVNQILADAIEYLYNSFIIHQKGELLLQAAVQIQAYLEMGFIYEENSQLFDKVLEAMNTERRILFPKKFYVAKKVKPTRNAVRCMIKKWPITNNRKYTIDELINDIIDKVKNKKEGSYYYQSTQGKGKTRRPVGMYELVVSSDECYFHDLIYKKYYEFDTE